MTSRIQKLSAAEILSALFEAGLIKSTEHIKEHKPYHGTCCCCGVCGEYHDECVCYSNVLVAAIHSAFERASKALEDCGHE